MSNPEGIKYFFFISIIYITKCNLNELGTPYQESNLETLPDSLMGERYTEIQSDQLITKFTPDLTKFETDIESISGAIIRLQEKC